MPIRLNIAVKIRMMVKSIPLEFCRYCWRPLGYLRRGIMAGMARAYLRLHGIEVGPSLHIFSLPFCRRAADATLQIGSHVTILNKLSENYAGVAHRTVLAAGAGARLIIGNHVAMSGAVLYSAKEIVIGDHVKLGAGAMVFDTDFHPLEACARRVHDVSKIKAAPVHIGEDVWIGAKAIVLKGVTIGPRAVVGAGAVVTRNVPADTLVAGVPAAPVSAIFEDVGRISKMKVGSQKTCIVQRGHGSSPPIMQIGPVV